MTPHPYPRGFVLSRQALSPPSHFIPGPLFENFFVDPNCTIDFASHEDFAVVVLGTCVDTGPELPRRNWLDQVLRRSPLEQTTDRSRRPVQEMLSALLKSEKAFFELIDQYCGRHAILYRTGKGIRVLTDATGMRAIFYAADGGLVASHARLIEEVLGGKIERNKLPFGYGYPGNHTPYSRTRLLTPNTLYDLTTSTVVRFWPRGPIKKLTAREAADAIIAYSATALQNVPQDHEIALSITAGLDSRTTLALAVHAGVPFNGYTYDRGAKTAVDCAVAHQLSKIVGFDHHVVEADKSSLPDDLRNAIHTSTFYNHHHEVIAPMRKHFLNRCTLAVTANLLEIGRFFYKGGIYDTIASVDSPVSMYEMYFAALPPRAREAVTAYGIDRYRTLATQYFAEFLDVSEFNGAREFLHSKDQFYWEHRMSAWHAMILLERDFYADCFIPFNSRRVFEAFLGVPEKERKSAKTFNLIIKKCAPHLLGIPINPREWPLNNSGVERIQTTAH